jgi:glycerol-3-phosphate acyltransferase PlsY
MQTWLCPLLAFLAGSIPFGLLISRMGGVDIRRHGSGNIGATNVLRTLGPRYGIPCLLLDALKGFLPVALATNLFGIEGRAPTIPLPVPDAWVLVHAPADAWRAQLFPILSALMAVIGHNHSPWIGFKGGKGIATSAGVLLALMPFAVLLLLALWGLLFLVTRYVSVASIGAAVALPFLTLWGSWHHGRIRDGTWNKALFALTVAIAVLAVWKHRSNIRRLLDGTEHRFSRKP